MSNETKPLWTDDEFPWVNEHMNAPTRLGISARIMSQWGQDWNREGWDESQYKRAHNCLADMADTITELLAALTAANQRVAELEAEKQEALALLRDAGLPIADIEVEIIERDNDE